MSPSFPVCILGRCVEMCHSFRLSTFLILYSVNVLGVVSGLFRSILRMYFVANRCIFWPVFLLVVSVVMPYLRILPIAAFQRSVLISSSMSGSWKALCFITCHVFFALVIRSSVARVVG